MGVSTLTGASREELTEVARVALNSWSDERDLSPAG
jgi:hypothetical protein